MANDKTTQQNLPLPAKKMNDVVNVERLLAMAINVKEVLNRPLNINTVQFRSGSKGEYMVMEVQDCLSGESMKVQTGGIIPRTLLTPIAERNQLPVSCVFFMKPHDDVIYMRDIEPSDLVDE